MVQNSDDNSWDNSNWSQSNDSWSNESWNQPDQQCVWQVEQAKELVFSKENDVPNHNNNGKG